MRDKDYAAHPRDFITDSMWAALVPLMPKGWHKKTTRSFLEAVIFRARTGIPWRDLPERFGPWSSARNRMATWTRNGWFEKLRLNALRSGAPDLGAAFIDTTSCKLHQSAAGSKKKGRAVGRSPGGSNTKVSALVDGAGRLLALALAPGNMADISCALATIGRWRPGRLAADRGYDARWFREWLSGRGIGRCVPSQSGRALRARPDRALYARRNLVERFFQRMKAWSGLAMRREKSDESFFSLLALFGACDWIKSR